MQCVFHSHRAHIEYSVRFLPQLYYTLSVDLCCGKMQIAHLRNAVANTLVNRSLRCLSAGNVCDWNSSIHRRTAHGQYLITITKHHQAIRLMSFKHFRKRKHRQPHCLRNRYRSVRSQQNLDFLSNRITILLNLLNSQAIFRGKMRSGYQKTQFKPFRLFYLINNIFQNPIFGPCRRDNRCFF